MKRELSPAQLAALLIVIGVLFSLLSSRAPVLFPGFSPMMAIAFVGAIYLPKSWGWLVGPVAMSITYLAYLGTNYNTIGSAFSFWALVYLAVYAAAGGLGILISGRKSLGKILGGSIACSLTFYVVSNTVSWITYQAPVFTQGYEPTLTGWWQANTTGVPGFEPTWHFLRNGMIGDLFFAVLMLFILDRSVLFGHAPVKSVPQTA